VVKLSNKKIAWIVKHVSSGEVSTKDAADLYGITQRRVEQLTKKYLEQGERYQNSIQTEGQRPL